MGWNSGKTWRALFCALLVVLAARGEAQQSSDGADAEPFAPLLRPSRFWPFWPSGALFEGDVYIPLPLRSRTGALRSVPQTVVDSSAYHGRGRTLTFLPHFTFRQSSDKAAPSAPVLTPTFNPGFEFSFFWLATRPRGKGNGFWFPTIAPTSRSGRLQALQVRLAHYSNGQAGCQYRNQAKDANDKCSPLAPGGLLNETDGSFSTNYIEGEYTYSVLLFDETLQERVRLGAGAALRFNPPGWMGSELAEAYGRTSATARVEFRSRHDAGFALFRGKPKGMIPLTITSTLEGEKAFGRHQAYPSSRVTWETSFAFPNWYGFGVATRLTRGVDYYNIGFGRRIGDPGIRTFSIGVIFDHSQAIALTREAKAATTRRFQ